MAKQTVPPLPLSKGWPRRVRSAAVHAIALARVALTTARGQAGTGIATRPGRPLQGQDFHLLEQRTFHGTSGPAQRRGVSREPAGALNLGGYLRADVARSRTLGVRLTVEGDLLSFVQGIELHRLALATVKEHFSPVTGRDKAKPTVCQFLDFPYFHYQHLLRCTSPESFDSKGGSR